jgi:uncharacterized phage protein gp47/JayE
MNTPFATDFDTLLAGLLTAYKNQFPTADTSQGSMIFLKSAVTAGAVWGLYHALDWACNQIFPDTADTNQLEHAANVRGLTRKPGESDADLLSRLLAALRNPPAGGNANDYVEWALSVAGVKAAYCVPLAQGLGTVDVLILASGSVEAPSSDLCTAVYNYINALRPVTASTMRVMGPTVITQAVTMSVTGNVDLAGLSAEITAYLNAMTPGAGLKLSQLYALAVNAGATDASISVPAANVPVTAGQMIRAGAVSVTEAS